MGNIYLLCDNSTVLEGKPLASYCAACYLYWFVLVHSILPAVTVSHIFAEKFGWQTLQIGLAYGGSLTIGSFLGETAGGWVVDAIIVRRYMFISDRNVFNILLAISA